MCTVVRLDCVTIRFVKACAGKGFSVFPYVLDPRSRSIANFVCEMLMHSERAHGLIWLVILVAFTIKILRSSCGGVGHAH